MSAVTLMIVVFLVLVILNVPIAFAMGFATILALLIDGTMPIQIVHQKMVSGIESFPFLAIPLFILTGGFMETGGISRRLVNFAQSIVGHIRGGLGLVMVITEMFFSGISGAATFSNPDSRHNGYICGTGRQQKGRPHHHRPRPESRR